MPRPGMAVRDNIATGAVKQNGLGGVDAERLATSLDRTGVTCAFTDRAEPPVVFDSSDLPPAADRRLWRPRGAPACRFPGPEGRGDPPVGGKSLPAKARHD